MSKKEPKSLCLIEDTTNNRDWVVLARSLEEAKQQVLDFCPDTKLEMLDGDVFSSTVIELFAHLATDAY
jgi:hypothetical protein